MVTLTETQRHIVRSLVESTKTVVIATSAGCGKTTTLNAYCDAVSRLIADGGALRSEAVLFVAPTGAAATLLEDGFLLGSRVPACTIARLCLMKAFWDNMTFQAGVNRLVFITVIIDEALMTTASDFSALYGRLKETRCRFRFAFVGDDRQLTAVGMGILSSTVFRRLLAEDIVVCTLRERHRFVCDDLRRLAAALDNRNFNTISLYMAERSLASTGIRLPGAGSDDGVLYLAALNEKVDTYNARAIAIGAAAGKQVYTVVCAKTKSILKRFMDGPVVVQKNQKKTRNVVNGTVGELLQLVGTPYEFVDPLYPFAHVLKNDSKLRATIATKEHAEYEIKPVAEAGGTWLPLATGYAMTIYKAQGSTFAPPGSGDEGDRAYHTVVVDIDGCQSFNELLVALTRTRTLGQLKIKGDIDRVLTAMAADEVGADVEWFRQVCA